MKYIFDYYHICFIVNHILQQTETDTKTFSFFSPSVELSIDCKQKKKREVNNYHYRNVITIAIDRMTKKHNEIC